MAKAPNKPEVMQRYYHRELNTLCYPRAALFVFLYTGLIQHSSTVLRSSRSMESETIETELSNRRCSQLNLARDGNCNSSRRLANLLFKMSLAEFVQSLRNCAEEVNPQTIS
jgi:hypothetical protein